MTASPSSLRPLLIALVGVALVSQSGCSWMRTKFGGGPKYQESVQAQPLEVPPGLDVPSTAGSVVIPNVTPNPMTQTVSSAVPPSAVSSDGFVLADTLESSYRRVGVALGKISGVTMGESAPLQHAHTVTYQGTPMQIRVEASGAGSRVFAVGVDGQPMTSGAATALLGLLKARLG